MPIDNKERTIDPMAIIVDALRTMKTPDNQIGPALTGIAKQASLPGGEMKQFGNTIFISNYFEKDGINVVYVRAFNADTAKNYLENGIKYFKYIMSKDVDYLVATFKESSVYSLFQQIKNPEIQKQVSPDVSAKVSIKQNKQGDYVVVVRIERSKK